ncbi:chemotaxis response regulator protein-glutamate methylesterase [Bacillus salitolerans]|uniref:Protein-glutamate methylesterase/protein-glutamine glutaminase n=1 Tax=Bacillus salitolerans TaxID=1437434 RepID=A0ABW4LP36_9BACI
MEKVKVLVVDDSAFMRKLITSFLEEDQRFEIVGIARNGQDAVQKAKLVSPDVITMDVEMPILNGIEALQEIMKSNPIPVVMLSSTTKEGAENTMLAFQYGAVDFITKPSGAISLDLHKVKDDILEKVYYASKVKQEKLRRYSEPLKTSIPYVENCSKIDNKEKVLRKFESKKKLVCIGTSTGGPRALQQVITNLPKDIDAPILIVQHMPPGFTKSLASRLDSLSLLEVKEAEDGEIIQNGVAYIAPGGFHLKVRKVGASLAVQLEQTPPKNGHRPSVDVMFESISKIPDYGKIAVIMTGMGSDGTEGLKTMKSSGDVQCIAESEDTSIVFGMPKSAIASQMVDYVTNLDEISTQITKLLLK